MHDETGALDFVRGQFTALRPELRATFRSWVIAHFDDAGNPIPEAPMNADEWKQFIETVQSLESFFGSAQAELYHLEHTPSTDTDETAQNRAFPALLLFYDGGGVIQRMRQKYPDRANVVNAAQQFEEYCKVLGVEPDPMKMPDRNALLRRRGTKL